MPKSAKKRREKAADFSKTKLKLGKGKQLANNAIDTSFKARSIALPSQSITVDKDADAPTTRRRLTFDDLIVHLKHYSAGTRKVKDAIAGLRELLDANPSILESSLTPLINAAVRLVGDEASWTLEMSPMPVNGLPGRSTVAGWNQSGNENGSRVLEGYLGILSAGTKFGETDGPMKATFNGERRSNRHVSSPHISRDRSESSPVSSIDTWYLASWFKTPEAYEAFDCLLQPSSIFRERGDCLTEHGKPRLIWNPMATPPVTTLFWDLLKINGRFSNYPKFGGDAASFVRDLERRIAASTDLKSILGYMSPYFPFKLNGSREIKAEQIFQALNLMFCELTALLVLTSETTTNRGGKRVVQKQRDTKDSLQVQTERVGEHVVQLLQGESLSATQLGRPLSSAAYTALLPTIWSLINNANASLLDVSNDVLQATIEHARKVSSKSALKQTTIEFLARLVLLNTEPQFNGHLNINASAAQPVAEWVNHLPRCLWELGSTNLAATEFYVNGERDWPIRSITHATRGQILGPYSKLPSTLVRRLALDLVTLIGEDSSLSSAVDVAVLGTEEEPYWRSIRN
ncbi:hypothetical protein B0H16DRAFT_1446174 [Mycena metata]|uniref:Pre-rRNA-processing protein n=1 Tax=Mycena metata TaxID=1033252 RepID=A0AAD7P3K6_9AGAR|nr:hypothetical protein B0H16DRAFT_1446174 [Mycena metata]